MTTLWSCGWSARLVGVHTNEALPFMVSKSLNSYNDHDQVQRRRRRPLGSRSNYFINCHFQWRWARIIYLNTREVQFAAHPSNHVRWLPATYTMRPFFKVMLFCVFFVQGYNWKAQWNASAVVYELGSELFKPMSILSGSLISWDRTRLGLLIACPSTLDSGISMYKLLSFVFD